LKMRNIIRSIINIMIKMISRDSGRFPVVNIG
jgi:hypothetical protein